MPQIMSNYEVIFKIIFDKIYHSLIRLICMNIYSN